MREVTVRDWVRSDLTDTGRVRAAGMRPQRISAAEPYCLKCEQVAQPTSVKGRWDEKRQATAMPFEPVFVRMSCGCTFGNEADAYPGSPHPTAHGTTEPQPEEASDE